MANMANMRRADYFQVNMINGLFKESRGGKIRYDPDSTGPNLIFLENQTNQTQSEIKYPIIQPKSRSK
jgi:hypothetical protein